MRDDERHHTSGVTGSRCGAAPFVSTGAVSASDMEDSVNWER